MNFFGETRLFCAHIALAAFAILTFASVAYSPLVHSETLKVPAIEDSFVTEHEPDDIRGTWQRMVTTGSDGYRKRGYLKFVIPKLPSGAIVTRVQLKVMSRSTASVPVGVYRALNDDWQESDLTWNHQPWWDPALISQRRQHVLDTFYQSRISRLNMFDFTAEKRALAGVHTSKSGTRCKMSQLLIS